MKRFHINDTIRVYLTSFILIVLIVIAGIGGFRASASKASQNTNDETASVRLKSPNTPAINLRPGLDLATHYDSADYSSDQMIAGQNHPLALASADFNVDGFPDLVTGYSAASGGILTFHKGNPEAFAPQSEESFALIKEGRFPDPFLEKAESYLIPAAPDFLVSGDFDRDGNLDVITATRGGEQIYLFSGTGKEGSFNAPREIELAGRVSALIAGEIDNSDNRADLLIGVEDNAGASLLVFENAESGVFAAPSKYQLPASAISLELGQLDDDSFADTAILTSGGVGILHGHNQRTDKKSARNAASRLEQINLPFSPQALIAGNFIWDRAGKTELALLTQDGTVQIAKRGELNERPFSIREAQLNRRQNAENESRGEKLKVWNPGSSDGWMLADSISVAASANRQNSSAPVLMKANLSGQNTDDILFLDSETRQIKILYTQEPEKSGGEVASFAGERSIYSLEAANQPVAMLSMKLNIFARPGLVILQDGKSVPSFVPFAPTAVFDVDRNDDTNAAAAQVCSAATNDCSLRGAITKANGAAGPDTINVPAGTYTLAIANGGAAGTNNNDDSNTTGDLDITQDLTIIGTAGQATTFIQGGTTNANGIDKVFASNPFCTTVVNTSLTGLTVRYGRNTQPNGSADFSYTGGGLDWCNPGANGTLTLTNSTFDSNSATTGPGGGIDLDTSSATSGTVTMTGVTISNNTSRNPASGGITIPADGGGLSIIGGFTYNVNITNSAVTGNTAQTSTGGGIYFGQSSNSGSALQISGTTISNNSAFSIGGGISFIGSTGGTTAFTLNQLSVVSGNTSGTGAAGVAQGGGVYVVASAGSATINKTTIVNNVLSATATTNRGGAGIAAGQGPITISYNRIVGNTGTATLGTGLNKDLNPGATNAINNWWGCSTGPSAAPCDTAVLTPGSTGTLATTPYIVLRHTASPSTIVTGQSTTLTASFLTNSAGTALNLTDITVLLGLPITFNNPVRGTLSNAQGTIQANGTATATFTGTSVGAGSADAIVDNDVAAAGRTNRATITINQASTTTTVASSLNPSRVGQAVTFTATVAPVAPGGGTPTGTVQFVVDGVNFGAPVALSGGTAISGTTSSLTAGTHTVSANYSGDTNYASSSGTLPGGQIVIAAPTISKSFGAASILVGASTSLSFTITNPAANTVALTGVGFTDTLPAGLVVATPNGLTGTCGGGTITATAGSGTVSLSGATLAINTSCTFSVNVTGTTAGVKNNSVTVNSTNGGTGNTATASITVIAPPDLTITKTHLGNFPRGQIGALYTITATNSGTGPVVAGNTVTVTDTLPSGLTATAISGTGWNCVLGTLTCTRGDALSASASYPAITIRVTVAANAPASVTNTATVAGGGETNTANDTANDVTNITNTTAAAAEISGRVLIRADDGLRNAWVTITDSSGNSRTTLTSSFGYFRFTDIQVGETYIISVFSPRYYFNPQSVSVTDNLTDLVFIPN